MAARIIGRSLKCGLPASAQKVKFSTLANEKLALLSKLQEVRKEHIDDLQQLKFESMLASTDVDSLNFIEYSVIPKMAKLILRLSDVAVEHNLRGKAEQRFLPNQVAYFVDVPGFDKKDLKVEIQGRILYVTGTRKDILGQDVSINKEAEISSDCEFDPEEGQFETRNGQVIATFPVFADRVLEKKTGRYVIRCI